MRSRRIRPFLTAEWRQIAMLNFAIDPHALTPLLPPGTELDAWRGQHFVSLVGFRFLDLRVRGLPLPGHRDFEEVNLRFYVRHRAEGEWRRAVVFVKEVVPRPLIAGAARLLYGENYVALPMGHRLEEDRAGDRPSTRLAYWWGRGRESRLELTVEGPPREPPPGSDLEFIVEHEWGCARRRGGTTEYRVEHPRWTLRTATSSRVECDAAGFYGAAFAEALDAPPASAFLADGSRVAVFRGRRLRI